MASIKTAYYHLINTTTATHTPCHTPIITVGGMGAELGNAVDRFEKSHDRQKGVFKPNSEIKEYFERLALKQMGLSELADRLGKLIYDHKYKEQIEEEPRYLFIAEGHGTVWVLDTPRAEGYFLTQGPEEEEASWKYWDMVLPKITVKNSLFFSVNLSNLEVTVLEPLQHGKEDSFYLMADLVLRAEMQPSTNNYVNRARDALYRTLKGTNEKTHLVEMKTKIEVDTVNRFERALQDSVKGYMEIDFKQVARLAIIHDTVLRNKFINELEVMGIYEPIETLTRERLKLKLAEYVSLAIKTKDGTFYPNAESINAAEINIKIKAIDGTLQAEEEG